MSIFDACLIRGSPRSIAVWPVCPGRTKTPAVNWRQWPSVPRSGGLYNQTGEFGSVLSKPGFIGSQYNYMPKAMQMLTWMPGSEVFHKARATGLRVADWQDLILVNMVGRRFYDGTASAFSTNDFGSIK